MKTLENNRLVTAFADLRAADRRTVVPFITGGFPDMAATVGLLKEFEARGVRVCEIGFPFSDSVADGPTIQESYYAALEKGACSQRLFDAVAEYRASGGAMALTAMVSESIVCRHDPALFVAEGCSAGFDAILVPDLPLEESADLGAIAADRAVCDVMLIAPTTPPDRRMKIARASTGFIYYISVSGITGERIELPPETLETVAELRTHVETPVCIGFGVSTPQMVAEVCKAADGAIVGSAIVKRIAAADRGHMVTEVGKFVGELLSPVQ